MKLSKFFYIIYFFICLKINFCYIYIVELKDEFVLISSFIVGCLIFLIRVKYMLLEIRLDWIKNSGMSVFVFICICRFGICFVYFYI